MRYCLMILLCGGLFRCMPMLMQDLTRFYVRTSIGCILQKTLFCTSEAGGPGMILRSEEHTSELQSLMRISYAVFCLKKKSKKKKIRLKIYSKRSYRKYAD